MKIYKSIKIEIEISGENLNKEFFDAIKVALKPDDIGLTDTKISYRVDPKYLLIMIESIRNVDSIRATLNDIFRCLRVLVDTLGT